MVIALQVGWHGREPNATSSSPFSPDKQRPWSDEAQKMLQLMTGQFRPTPETLDLLGGSLDDRPDELLELEPGKPLPCGWEKCLDLKTGDLYYMNWATGTRSTTDPRKLSSGTLESSTSTSSQSKFKDSVTIDMERACLNESKLMGKENTGSAAPCREEVRRSEGDVIVSSILGKRKPPIKPLLHVACSGDSRIVKACITSGAKEGKDEGAGSEMMDSTLELKLTLPTSSRGSLTRSNTEKTSPCAPVNAHVCLEQEKRNGSLRSDVSRGRSGFATTVASPVAPSYSTHSILSLQATEELCLETEKGVSSVEEDSQNASFTDRMAIIGCPRCLMYVMLCKADPRCPKCGSSVNLLDFPRSLPKRVGIDLNC